MDGLMMEYPLTLEPIFRRAETLFRHKAIVTRRPDKSCHRTLDPRLHPSERFAGRTEPSRA